MPCAVLSATLSVLAQERVSAWETVSATEWVVEEKLERAVVRATAFEVVSAFEVERESVCAWETVSATERVAEEKELDEDEDETMV